MDYNLPGWYEGAGENQAKLSGMDVAIRSWSDRPGDEDQSTVFPSV